MMMGGRVVDGRMERSRRVNSIGNEISPPPTTRTRKGRFLIVRVFSMVSHSPRFPGRIRKCTYHMKLPPPLPKQGVWLVEKEKGRKLNARTTVDNRG